MTRSSAVPSSRLRTIVDRTLRPDGEFVLYWMTATRRLAWSHALDRAVELARETRRPLVVLEAIRAGYPWASRRHHAFVLRGMADNRRRAASAPLAYLPYVEPAPDAGTGLLAALAKRAVAVVADDWPAFFLGRMLESAGRQIEARLEAVDSNGLLPFRSTERAFPTAFAFRRHLQAELAAHLRHPPAEDPLDGLDLPVLESPEALLGDRWPIAPEALLEARPEALAALPIDADVSPVETIPGGREAGVERLGRFLDERLDRYAEERNHPDADAASGLSPYLHYGHVSTHEILAGIGERHGWTPELLPSGGRGAREGWWGLPKPAEAFLDQVVTWRELGMNFCVHRPGEADRFDSLPDWARATLAKHAGDPRDGEYSLERLEAAESDDEIWNAAQRQLREEGCIQNYLRMLWGKRVIAWSRTPEEAAERLVALNDRWALDGRDPNSYSGIFWCFGRYDRPWGPERPIYGTVRYMTSASTRRKLRLSGYLERFGDESSRAIQPRIHHDSS